MPFVKITDEQMNHEKALLNHAYETDPEVKAAIDAFDAECRIRKILGDARKANNLSQQQMKSLSGLSQQAISRIETDTSITPGLKNLIKYANALDYELVLQPKQTV